MKENEQQKPGAQRVSTAIMQLNQQNALQAKIIWLLLSRIPGKSTMIDLRDLDRFWELQMDPEVGEKRSRITLAARAAERPNDEEIRELADYLRGTDKPLGEAIKELDVKGNHIVVFTLLGEYLAWQNNKWIDVALADLQNPPDKCTKDEPPKI